MAAHARPTRVTFIGTILAAVAMSVAHAVVDPNVVVVNEPSSLPSTSLAGLKVADFNQQLAFASLQGQADEDSGRPLVGLLVPDDDSRQPDPEAAADMMGFAMNCEYAYAINDRWASLLSVRTSYFRGGFDVSAFDSELQYLGEVKKTTDALDCPNPWGVPSSDVLTGSLMLRGIGNRKLDIYPGHRFALPFDGARDDYGYDADPATLVGEKYTSLPFQYLGYQLGAEYLRSDGSYAARYLTGVDAYRFLSGNASFKSPIDNMQFKYFDFAVGSRPVTFGNQDLSTGRFPGRSVQYGDLQLPLKFQDEFVIGDRHYVSVRADRDYFGFGNYELKWDPVRMKLLPPDPYLRRTGNNDQWAIKRVGLTAAASSAWALLPATPTPIVVAVIDSGLDWHHQDLDWRNVWRNEDEIPDNGIDDDGNGYVDDVIGWNFVANDNYPWDLDGHGTLVAGIIAAAQNDRGVAGIDPNAKIMVLKAVDNAGISRASLIAKAIAYAIDNGARIINLSVGGEQRTEMEQRALRLARDRNVLVVVAAGNEGRAINDYAFAAEDNVIAVGATHTNDRAAAFSNFGDDVDLVAPGVDVIGPRARFTDTNFAAGADDYEIGTNYLGPDKRYIRVSGTSFAAPIVTGVASLVLSARPQLSAAEVEQILFRSAEDLEFPGPDQHTGHGMVDARRALTIDPDFKIDVDIAEVALVRDKDEENYRITGTASTDQLKRAWITIGKGDEPSAWKHVGRKIKRPIVNGELSNIAKTEFSEPGRWQVVVHAEHKNGIVRNAVRALDVQ